MENLTKAKTLDFGAGLLNIASAYTAFSASRIQARGFKVQSLIDEVNAKNEELNGKEIANNLREQFLRNISSANASFAARNISVGSGIGRQFTIQSLANLNRDLKMTELNSKSAVNALKLRSRDFATSAKIAQSLGLIRSFRPAFEGTTSLLTALKPRREVKK